MQKIKPVFTGIHYRLAGDTQFGSRSIEVYDTLISGVADFEPVAITTGTTNISMVSRRKFVESREVEYALVPSDELFEVKKWHSKEDAPVFKTTLFKLNDTGITLTRLFDIPALVSAVNSSDPAAMYWIAIGHDLDDNHYHSMFNIAYTRQQFYLNDKNEICVDGAPIKFWVESLGDPDKKKDVTAGEVKYIVLDKTSPTLSNVHAEVFYSTVDRETEVKIAMMSYGETVIIPITLNELMQLVADIRKDRTMTNVRNVTGETMSIRTASIDGIRLLSSEESATTKTKPASERCEVCGGNGIGFLEECYACDGTGIVQK